MTAPTTAPVLSTDTSHLFEIPKNDATTTDTAVGRLRRLSDDQLDLQYEIRRTVAEIRRGRWKRIGLQFPDGMLGDAPRVFDRLTHGLAQARSRKRRIGCETDSGSEIVTRDERGEDDPPTIIDDLHRAPISSDAENLNTNGKDDTQDAEERLCILGDTSYGACCVDEIAAEHAGAGVVVHYGRACLSPTARLPVIYVFTSPPIDLGAVTASFRATFPDPAAQVCLMADIPYAHHIPDLCARLREEGYTELFATEVKHQPYSLLPNRTIPPQAEKNPEALKAYSIFHISEPPASLLLILASRVKDMYIYPTNTPNTTTAIQKAITLPLLRKRYALLTMISSAPIIGILINTLSTPTYMATLTHLQELIAKAGKKAYTFVVGKVNAAKLANFDEVGVWVVVGCWESSLLDGTGFYKPAVTVFEFEVGLAGEAARVWGGEWGVEGGAMNGELDVVATAPDSEDTGVADVHDDANGDWDENASDDEPPDYDLRTGRYVPRTKPPPLSKSPTANVGNITDGQANSAAPPSSAVVQRAKGDVATINGAVSAGAEYLRSKRTWTGLGSDYEIAYERDDAGNIRGAAMESGRGGVAKGYAVGSGERT